MLKLGQTAEEFLGEICAELEDQAELGAGILKPLYGRASESTQTMMIGELDRAEEAERLLTAFRVAREVLGEPAEPRPDRGF